MRTIKTYFKHAPFCDAFLGAWPQAHRIPQLDPLLASSLCPEQGKVKMRKTKGQIEISG